MKILPSQVAEKLQEAHQKQQRVVLVTGVFDLLHQEHLNFLKKARQAGEFLLVAIESDSRVKALKGPGRPVQTQEVRLSALQNLDFIDEAFILPEEFGLPAQHDQLIQEVLPTFLAVSSHSPHLDRKRAILQKYGGEVLVVHEHNPAISTTLKIAALQAESPAD